MPEIVPWSQRHFNCLRCGARNWGLRDGQSRDIALLVRCGCSCGLKEDKMPVGKKNAKKKTSKKAGTSVVGGDVGSNVSGPTVHVQVGKTINLGDYETLRVDYGETHVVNPGQTHDEVADEARASVNSQMESLIEEMTATFGS